MKKTLAVLFCAAAILSACAGTMPQHVPAETGAELTRPAHEHFRQEVLAKTQKLEKKLGCRIGLFFKDKDLPVQVEFRPDERFHAASTMKTPVMIEVFRQADEGLLSLDEPMLIDPVCQSFLEDTTFVCDARGYMLEMLGKKVPIRKITEQMIVVSDNLATNMLIAKTGYRSINSTMRRLGAERGYVLRGVQDDPAYLAGLSNRMTARDLSILLDAIDNDRAGTPESCKAMREILLAQEYNTMIPALLPEDVRVAHKTGAITGVRHDSAIVYAPFGTWYLTILMDELEDGDKGIAAAAELSRFIYDERKKLAE